MLIVLKYIEETDLKRRRMKSEDRKMKEIEMTKIGGGNRISVNLDTKRL